jgi:cytochrome d ubiquinol oxidase subunit I
MNHPTGFTLRNGHAVNVHPWSALFGNSYFWHEFIHMYFAGYIVAGFLIAVPYAWGFLKGRWGRYERTALAVALSAAAIAAPLQLVIGDWAARDVATTQPVKLAAMEGLANTTRGASEHILGWYNGHSVVDGIAIPHLLSLLAFHSWNAPVKGLNIVSKADQPPVNIERFSFQTMVGIGTLLALLGVVYLYVRFRRKRLPTSKWFYRAVVLAGPASLVALIAGWMTTEIGRQPWIVYGFMRVSQAVTGASGVPVGDGVLVLVYIGLAIAVGWMLRRFSRVPLESNAVPSPPPSGVAGAR